MHRLSDSGKLPPTNTLAPSMIETLPYSVLELIFLLACTDGGRTGRSLSLVSKTIHVTSRAARFHSVSLLIGNSDQLVRFMQALDTARADARAQDVSIPYVRHLCISLTPAFSIPNLKLIDEDFAAARLKRPFSAQGYSAWEIEVWHEYHRTFQSLCTAIFHDLETLCLLRHTKYIYDMTSQKKIDAIPEIPLPHGFPRLRKLTFAHNLRPPFVHAGDTSPDPMTEGRQGTTALYPALRRLHMSTSPRAEMDFEWWALNAPHLTWLRIHTSRWATSPSGIRFLPSLTLVLGNRRAGDADPHGGTSVGEGATSYVY
ncbi:uncharacterized protein TRAVEDRAFT_50705 [Trametes versicolor FP-101664 SS1]|uniref:uncharacterized protein n=1 Tax=Trametes versicolor (strain FP-101664) TaxID=717944 RepID=UPI00046243F5|nr:uncharacterized protein TRAVEDRAFT_50705 [Trametes versicolor FP-101664 SS1]EIW56223.1 hypothetical protein TRAVEDRAFT_50705 [Trametes versicolor FP-101664 SS1]